MLRFTDDIAMIADCQEILKSCKTLLRQNTKTRE